MSQLYLVRHGQASFGAANYDQLSPLGYQQAQWLGEHFRELGIHFDRAVTGSLSRQQQTAQAVLAGIGQTLPVHVDDGFNEFDFHGLAAIYCRFSGIPLPGTDNGGREFFQMLRKAMIAWSRGELHAADADTDEPVLETWEQFHDRVQQALQQLIAREQEETVLAVSSGGAMAMALSQVLQCGVDTLINLNMQTRNTGVHHLFYNQRGYQLAGFNSLAHLQRPGRLNALSYT
ncbi:MAG: histidine phosphatase [Gammaproteobacteria bacterium]|nr:histidine phosphatase [Gammaproteobacteria bacterium]|tara:strand:+ start:9184 stop:9879 length:696 start_codon:yes stop_codon:yes gene_type:complete